MSAVSKSVKGQFELLEGSNKRSGDDLRSLQTPELVIALCGPIGSPLHDVALNIADQLINKFGYKSCETIRMSQFIENYRAKAGLPSSEDTYKRIQNLIQSGNDMREKFGTEILAKLAIRKIAADRVPEMESSANDENDDAEARSKTDSLSLATKPLRIVHIIDSIKNQSELDILKLVYGDLLYTIGVYAPLSLRIANLKRKGLKDAEVSQLIDRDSGEERETGQTVRQTFPFSDYFLRIEERTQTEITERVERFISLILGSRPHTPTTHEMAMYSAASAAGHSACLSRQVGACVTSAEGEILASGWNDVPRFGGGLYISDDNPNNDLRCWNKDGGKCFNDEEKDFLAERVSKNLIDNEFVAAADKPRLIESLRHDSGLRDLIEFSRSIHAEMHAILRSLQFNGNLVVGGRIYVTTYPCHSCARHIIAAGIKEVIFIEPYRKSLAIKLHDDAISEDENAQNKVILRQYDGVAPRRFMSIFKSSAERKQHGKLVTNRPISAMPVAKLTLEAVPRLEAMVVSGIDQNAL
ncbi:anti-phage dCTP deaminase [Collimonas fungivorans]|uniref:anti-phage dCTP deaminase n=1 Tax=Collimonas fungivorans TaxID=158899 RepID=UPI003FA38D7D